MYELLILIRNSIQAIKNLFMKINLTRDKILFLESMLGEKDILKFNEIIKKYEIKANDKSKIHKKKRDAELRKQGYIH